MDKSNLFWQTYLNLEKDVLSLSQYIFFTDETIKNNQSHKCIHQLQTYSPYISDLLVRCCVEIEAISKELYFDNGGTKQRGDKDVFFDTDCISLLNDLWKIDDVLVMVSSRNFNFTRDENKYLTPLKNAYKRSKTNWAKAYQSVKHDRYNSMHLGNISNVINAMAALYLLNVYNRNIVVQVNFSNIKTVDLSLGSQLFSLKIPNISQLWEGNLTDDRQSPYIAKYLNDYFTRIKRKQEKELQDMKNYLSNQPERNESGFIKMVNGCTNIMGWFTQLFIYRIHNIIPRALEFEEKKKLFITNPIWNGQVRMLNEPLKEEELTLENIDEEIAKAARFMGMETMRSFKNDWYSIAMKGDCELVINKGNIKYN
ncbi:MAG: hypothetical protein R3Y65_06730 [Bacillota bacterium]